MSTPSVQVCMRERTGREQEHLRVIESYREGLKWDEAEDEMK